jgi:hypothetical protein
MSLILGILDSGGAAASLTSYESIATVTVGSGGSANVEFTSIPADYTHLQVRGIGRGTGAGTSTNVQFTFNSDTSSNYSFHGLLGDGSTAFAEGNANQSNGRFWMISNGGAGASMFGAFV